MKRGVRLENVFLASFYIPLKAFLYKKQSFFCNRLVDKT